MNQLQAETKALKAQLQAAGIKANTHFKSLKGEEPEEEKKKEEEEDNKLALTDLKARYDQLKETSELKIASLNDELARAIRRPSHRVSLQRSPIVGLSKFANEKKEGIEEDEVKTDSEEDEEAEKEQTELEVELEQARIALEDARLTITAKSQYIDEIETEIKVKEYTITRKNTALSVRVKALEQEKVTAEKVIDDYQTRIHS